MTITTQTFRAQYNGNGSTDEFSIPFEFIDQTGVKVILTDADGVDTTWVHGTQYTITNDNGTPIVGRVQPTTGKVVVDTSPTDYTPATGERLTILRNEPFTQAASYTENGPFPAKAHERALDRLDMQIHTLKEQINRAPKYAETSTNNSTGPVFPEPEADKIIGWNAAGDELENKALTDLEDGLYEVIDDDTMATASADTVPTSESVKAYVDGKIIDEDDMASDSATKVPTQQSVKAYVDAIPLRLATVATTANITLSGVQSINGVTGAAGQVVLVKNQSTASQNGLYAQAAGAWPRLTSFNNAKGVRNGARVYVTSGSGAGLYVLACTDPVTVGTTALAFTLDTMTPDEIRAAARVPMQVNSDVNALAHTVLARSSDEQSIFMRLLDSTGLINKLSLLASTAHALLIRTGTSETQRVAINNSLTNTLDVTGEIRASGTVKAPASATGAASLNVPHGTAPSSPNNGDFWSTTAALFARINGATQKIPDMTDWAAWTPTVTAASGSFTTLGTVVARWCRIGKVVHGFIEIPITTNGTAAGAVDFTLPGTAAVPVVGYGRETVSGGKQLQVGPASTTVGRIANYDNTYPGADGYTLRCRFVYEVA